MTRYLGARAGQMDIPACSSYDKVVECTFHPFTYPRRLSRLHKPVAESWFPLPQSLTAPCSVLSASRQTQARILSVLDLRPCLGLRLFLYPIFFSSEHPAVSWHNHRNDLKMKKRWKRTIFTS